MQCITTSDGTVVSYDKYGERPALVLVHGAFSDHHTNWEFVKPLFEKLSRSLPLLVEVGVKQTRPKVIASRMKPAMLWP